MTDTPSIERYHATWHRAARFIAQRMILGPVIRAVTRMSVEGLDNVDRLSGPFILVANHASHLDTAVILTGLPYRVTGRVAVGAAGDYFFSKWWIKAVTSLFFNTYPVNRSGVRRKGQGLSQRLLESGVPLLIYPEGTRSRDGLMKRFKPGAAALCVAESVPCVPVALIGTYAAMPVGRSWPVPGRPKIRILVGQPMRSAPGEKPREFSERINGRVVTMLEMQTPYVVGEARGQAPGHGGAAQKEAL